MGSVRTAVSTAAGAVSAAEITQAIASTDKIIQESSTPPCYLSPVSFQCVASAYGTERNRSFIRQGSELLSAAPYAIFWFRMLKMKSNLLNSFLER